MKRGGGRKRYQRDDSWKIKKENDRYTLASR
jgi:hypothetical protein